jgi:hypothetical protein
MWCCPPIANVRFQAHIQVAVIAGDRRLWVIKRPSRALSGKSLSSRTRKFVAAKKDRKTFPPSNPPVNIRRDGGEGRIDAFAGLGA